MNTDYASMIVVIGVVLLIVAIFREVTCWYFKFTAMVSLLTEIRNLLRDQRGNRNGEPSEPVLGQPVP